MSVPFATGASVTAKQLKKEKMCRITEFGAVSGGDPAANTEAVNRAVLAASEGAGGTVVIPAGEYKVYTIRLKSHVNLYLEKGSVLRGTMQALSDEELRGKTEEYKKRLTEGETLDDLLPEAYATVREAAKRVLNMEHYRVQLIGGIILHQGRIAEMRTGEGKTLVSTLPAYLNALEGKGVHVVTVNDYLAKRDAEWMGQVHEFLGLKVGVVLNTCAH